MSASACETEQAALIRALGEGCVQNSECAEGLACVFRRCHVACNTSQDCPIDAAGERLRCRVGDKPENVCQLDNERVCERHSDCPLHQTCALDDRCRDGCSSDRDCVSGQVCRASACADVDELVDDQLVVATASGVIDRPCSYSSECPAGPGGLTLFCRDGACSVGCYEQRDCPRFFRCSTADDPSTPGDCELIGERGRLFCDPQDAPRACACSADVVAEQACKLDGSALEPCPCP